MTKHKKYDWPALLAAFDGSGLSQAEFCKTQGIDACYFSQRRRQILAQDTPLIPVTIDKPSINNLVVEVGRCKIHCPQHYSLDELKQLLQALA